MAENEEWNSIEVSDKVEYEVEESDTTTTATNTEESKVNTSSEEKDPEELDGIQTKGAQKRIRQLVQQRKERDEQINALVQQNGELAGMVGQKNQEVKEINKLTLDSSERQLTDKIDPNCFLLLLTNFFFLVNIDLKLEHILSKSIL